MKISVIIPCYNVEKYISKCIESIETQTFENAEYIFIDDGSTDNTVKIISSYKNNKFKIIKSENNGVASARNIGMQNATGDTVTFIDSDDYINDDFLEEMSKLWLPGSIVFSSAIKFNNEGKNSKLKIGTKSCNMSFSVWGKLYDKKMLVQEFPNLKIGEDVIFNLKVYNKKPKILFAERALYYYRVNREGSLSKKYFGTNRDAVEIIEFLKMLEQDSHLFYEMVVKQHFMWATIITNMPILNYSKYRKIVGKFWFTKLHKPKILFIGWLLKFRLMKLYIFLINKKRGM